MPDVAEKLLQSNGWDIESAVQAYFQVHLKWMNLCLAWFTQTSFYHS